MSKITTHQLAVYAVEELEKGSDVKVVARKLASYLLDNRQSRDLSRVMRGVEDELNRRGKTQISITSAYSVSDAVRNELASLLEAKMPVFHETIDKSVIGGVKARAGELEIDLTVRGKLNRFKAKIVTGS